MAAAKLKVFISRFSEKNPQVFQRLSYVFWVQYLSGTSDDINIYLLSLLLILRSKLSFPADSWVNCILVIIIIIREVNTNSDSLAAVGVACDRVELGEAGGEEWHGSEEVRMGR